jgi:hypothetical protein
MSRAPHDGKSLADLDELIEQITTDAYGDDEQLWAFRQAFEDEVALPVDGFVIGEPVSVIEIDYDSNVRQGLTARCRREDGSEHVVAASDIMLPPGSGGARHLAAYRKWLGLDPYPSKPSGPARRKRQPRATEALDLSRPVELVALSVKERAVRCRLLGHDRVITLRANSSWDVVPGEIVTVRPRKQWSYSGHSYLSGEIESIRLDVHALGLVPLRLEALGMWDPGEHYWGEGESMEEWAKEIIARGPRRELEMEQVLPGQDLDDGSFADPICASNDLKEAGDRAEARKLLMDLAEADLRCLDAHAHLGNLVFDGDPKSALRHYAVGLRIGEISLGEGFEGVLPWGCVDNRPFLRCMHGYALCLWRLGRHDEAARMLDRMLWLNPSDNQGVRFMIEEAKLGKAWEEQP